MVFRMDEKDRAILTILQDQGRVPISEIALQVRLSRTAVRYRLKMMEDFGLISGYTIVVNPLKIESSVFVNILLQVKPMNLNKCIRSLMHMKEVVDVYHLSGESPLLITAFFRNPQHLNNFTLTKLEQLPIENYSMQPVVQIVQKGTIPLR